MILDYNYLIRSGLQLVHFGFAIAIYIWNKHNGYIIRCMPPDLRFGCENGWERTRLNFKNRQT